MMENTDIAVSRFIVLTFIFNAIGYGPLVLASYGLIPQELSVMLLIGGASPTIAAIILTHSEFKDRGDKYLFGAFQNGGFSPVWYLIVLLIPLIRFSGELGLAMLTGVPINLSLIDFTMFIPLLISQILVNIWEEIGWRGYALPRLQNKHDALVSSVILGIVWALWHIPLFLVKDSPMAANGGTFEMFVVDTIMLTIVFTWVYNSTNGNLLIATLLHAAINAEGIVMTISPGFAITTPYHLIANGVMALIVIVVFGTDSLSNREKMTIDKIVAEADESE